MQVIIFIRIIAQIFDVYKEITFTEIRFYKADTVDKKEISY